MLESELDSQSREPGSNPLCCRFEASVYSFSPRPCSSSLHHINVYLVIDGAGNMRE